MTSDSLMENEKAGIGVVARAAAILRVLGDVATGMSLGQIASRVGLARSTVQRLVYALDMEGLVMSGAGAGQITLGPEFMRLAKRARPNVIDRVRPHMEQLSRLLEETVDFSVVQRNGIVFLDQVMGSQRLVAVSHIGDTFPLHCSSVGKAYLATLNDTEIKRTIGISYERRTDDTLVDFDALQAALGDVRRNGVALDCEEHSEGISACGIAFEDGSGNWYGLSVPMPVGRFRLKSASAGKELQKIQIEMPKILAPS